MLKHYTLISSKCGFDLQPKHHILSVIPPINPVLWVANFSIYKAHLLGCEGKSVAPCDTFLLEAQKYKTLKF